MSISTAACQLHLRSVLCATHENILKAPSSSHTRACAGIQSTDCKQHPEDAMAVQLLLQALQPQSQLQVVELHLHSPLPRPEMLQRQPQSGWGHTLAIFHPLWKQLNCILRHSLWLRYSASFSCGSVICYLLLICRPLLCMLFAYALIAKVCGHM